GHADFERDAAAFDIAEISQRLSERPDLRQVEIGQHTDGRNSGCLGMSQEGGCPQRRSTGCRRRDEMAPSHSMISVAKTSRCSGILSPSASAVFLLMTRSKTIGCSTGRSAGLAPFKMRST